MGRPIVYCAECGKSLPEIEFDQGRAFTADNRPFCTVCRPAPERVPEPALPTATPRRPIAAKTARVPVVSPSKRVPPALWIGGGAAALLLVVAVAVLSAPSPPPPPPPPDPVPAPKPVARTPEPNPPPTDPAKLDGFLAEIRKIMTGEEIVKRKGEVESMLKSALEAAGPRRRDVEDLKAEFGRRLLQAELRGALVGHWPLDATLGSTAADASGRNQPGRLERGPRWVDGQVGGGLRFDGADDYVEIPNSATLDKLHESSFTLAAWFRPERDPPGKDRAPTSAYGILMKEGYNAGLCYVPGTRFSMKHWIAGNKDAGAASESRFPPGRFYHVAGVVDVDAGATRLYVDGKMDKSSSFPPKTAGRDFKAAKWRIGTAKSDATKEYAWPAQGVIDDVRVYNRPLTDAEVRFLFDESAAGRSP